MPNNPGGFSLMREIADLLASYDIEIGYPDRRDEMAARLQGAGLKAADIRVLHAYCCRSTEPWHVSGLLYWLLELPERWEPKLADLLRFASQRAGFGDRPYVPKPMDGEDPERWRVERREGMLRCRAKEVGVEAAAMELGIDPVEAKNICGKEERRLAPTDRVREVGSPDRSGGRRKSGGRRQEGEGSRSASDVPDGGGRGGPDGQGHEPAPDR